MASQLYYFAAFTLILIASTAYYIAAAILAPRPRKRGEAVSPYACGEKGYELERADPPYPFTLIIFAITESVPLAAIFCMSETKTALLPLIVAALAPPLLIRVGQHECH